MASFKQRYTTSRVESSYDKMLDTNLLDFPVRNAFSAHFGREMTPSFNSLSWVGFRGKGNDDRRN